MPFQSKFVAAHLMDNIKALNLVREFLAPNLPLEKQAPSLKTLYFTEQPYAKKNYFCLCIRDDERILQQILKTGSFENILIEQETEEDFKEFDPSRLSGEQSRENWIKRILLESSVRRILRTFLCYFKQISWVSESQQDFFIPSNRWNNQEFWMHFLFEGSGSIEEIHKSWKEIRRGDILFKHNDLYNWLSQEESELIKSLTEQYKALFEEKSSQSLEDQESSESQLANNQATYQLVKPLTNVINLDVYKTPTIQLVKFAYDELLFTGVVFKKKEEVRQALGKIIERKGLKNISNDQVKYIATMLRPDILQKGQNVSQEEIEEAKKSFLKHNNMKEFKKTDVFD